MRVRLVARLLAVMLASPVVAFTIPGESLTKAEPTASTVKPAEPPSTPPGDSGATSTELVASPVRSCVAAECHVVAPAEVRISVDCGRDGCVVQEGLAVLVVGEGAANVVSRELHTSPARRSNHTTAR